MKKLILITLLLSSILIACGGDNEEKDKKSKESNDEATHTEGDESNEEDNVGQDEVNEVVLSENKAYRSKQGEDGLYGYVDENDNWIVEPTYKKTAFYMRNGMGAVTGESYNYGYVDLNGELVIPCKYRFGGDFTKDGTAPVKLEVSGKKWIYINKKDETVLEVNYDQCSGFYEGLAVVSNQNKSGMINKKGEVVIPLKYSGFTAYLDEEGGGSYFNYGDATSVKSVKNDKRGLIDRTGKELTPFKYDRMPTFAQKHNLIEVTIGEKRGVIDVKGNEVVPVEYDQITLTNLHDHIKAKKGNDEFKFSLTGEKM